MKLSKKILSIVLSVLMVVSTMPFTAVTAFAADANYEKVEKAIETYEKKMNEAKTGGKIYTNMPAAYSAYVAANQALKKACAGDETVDTVDLANAASKLTEATGKMETYTAPGFTTVAPKFPGNDIGAGYYGNIIYYGTEITDISGDGNELNSYGIAGNRLYGKMHCNKDTVLVYDGTKDALKLPVTVQFTVRRTLAGNPAFKVASVYSNGGSWTLYQDWFGNSGSSNTWPTGTSSLNHIDKWDNGKLLESTKAPTFYYYGNCVKYSGTPDETVYYNHYNKGSDLNFTVFSQGDYKDKNNKRVALSPIQADGDANIYVLNYQGFKKLVANSLKDKDVNVANYKNGGLTTYLNQIDTASKYSPNDAKTGATNGKAIADAFSDVATGLKNAKMPAADKFEITHSSSSPVSNWTVTKAATCAAVGSKTGNCVYCNAPITAEIPIDPNAHSFTNYVYDENATCTVGGTKTATCDLCKTAEDTIPDPAHPATGVHKFTTYEYNDDATCTKQGTMTAICDYDGCDVTDTKADPSHPATGVHTFTDYKYNNDATCTKQGTMTATCDVCKAETDTKDDPSHPATGVHTFTDYKYNNDATCTVDGTKTATCDVCKTAKDTIPDPDHKATGHNYSGAVTQMYESGLEKTTKDYKHSVACVNDGSHTKEVQCTFVRATELDVPATETTEGKEYEKCSVCGGTRYTVTEKLPAEDKPNNSASLTVNDAVDFNFYIDTEYYINNSDFAGTTKENLVYEVSYIEKSVDYENPTKDVVDTITVSEAPTDSQGRTLIKVKTAPAQLTEIIKITLKVKDSNSEVTVIDDYSMKSYCDQVIDYNLSSAPVCKELIKYAATAQVNFNYNTANMAADVNEAFKNELDADYNAVEGSVSATSNVQQDLNDEFKITGVSYVALADTTIRFYLDKTNAQLYAEKGFLYSDYEISAVTMEDQKGSRTYNAYFAQNADGKVYIAVSGIEAANLDNAFTFTVTNSKSDATTTVTYSATAYCKTAVVRGKDTLKDLAKAIVLYNVAADKVF